MAFNRSWWPEGREVGKIIPFQRLVIFSDSLIQVVSEEPAHSTRPRLAQGIRRASWEEGRAWWCRVASHEQA
jgi:hypothetical protein